MDHEEKWLRIFELALESYRQTNPTDQRSDTVILFEMMDVLYDHGIADKNTAGEYVLPMIVNHEALFRRMASHRN